jgi:hypothetical protein
VYLEYLFLQIPGSILGAGMSLTQRLGYSGLDGEIWTTIKKLTS